MPRENHKTAARNVAGWAILLSVGFFLTGCVSHSEPYRPTVDDLIAESFNQSLAAYEIDDAEYVDHYPEGIIGYEEIVGADVVEATISDRVYFTEDQANQLRFSEEFIETDVREVLLTLAQEAGIDLVMGEKVNGVVNTRLDNMPLDQAIEKVLMPLGLHFARRGDQYIVASADPESPLFPYIAQRMEYRPRHLDAKTLVGTVPVGVAKYVQIIDGANLIMVEAPVQIAREIVDRFASIDQPIPQVILEAIICVVSPDSGFQFGLDWQHAVELNGKNALKLGAAGLAISSNYSRAGANAVFSDFAQTSTFVKLLNEHGYLTIRASPHVMAEDGKQATIAINRETFFSVQPIGNADSSSFFFQQDIQTVDAGITLDITPRIRGDIVTIDIEKAEVSEDIRNANAELAVNPFPIINRRSVSTTVHVKDGKTIVIGGLVQRETIDRVNRVPGLSKIPLVGYLFETTQRQTRDAEIVIFISPRIVMPPRAMD